jgi:hypothetical protein
MPACGSLTGVSLPHADSLPLPLTPPRLPPPAPCPGTSTSSGSDLWAKGATSSILQTVRGCCSARSPCRGARAGRVVECRRRSRSIRWVGGWMGG